MSAARSGTERSGDPDWPVVCDFLLILGFRRFIVEKPAHSWSGRRRTYCGAEYNEKLSVINRSVLFRISPEDQFAESLLTRYVLSLHWWQYFHYQFLKSWQPIGHKQDHWWFGAHREVVNDWSKRKCPVFWVKRGQYWQRIEAISGSSVIIVAILLPSVDWEQSVIL